MGKDHIGYGVPHLVAKGTRHDAVGRAAIVGRKAPDEKGGVMDFTKAVTWFTNQPPNRRRNNG